MLYTLLALAVLGAQTPATDGAKILAVYAFPGKSHYMMHRVLISELVKHGHQVRYYILYIIYDVYSYIM